MRDLLPDEFEALRAYVHGPPESDDFGPADPLDDDPLDDDYRPELASQFEAPDAPFRVAPAALVKS